MDNLSFPQPIKCWLRFCRRHRPHLFFIGTFLMRIGILVVLFHTNNTTAAVTAAAAAAAAAATSSADSIQHEREKRQTNQNGYEELQSVPLRTLQHGQSTFDLTVITAPTSITTTRSPLFTSNGNENVNAAAVVDNERGGQNRKTKHQSIADRHQSSRQPHQRQNVVNLRSMPTSVTKYRQQKHDTMSNANRNRLRYNSINNIENSMSGGSSHRNHIPKINNNNFSLRSNFTSNLRVLAFAKPNVTIGVGDVKRPLPLPSSLLVHRQQQFSNIKRKMYANASISSRPNENHPLVQGNDGYLAVRKYTCIMCKVIPGEPMRRPSQSLNNNKQWNRGMCPILCFKFCLDLPSSIY